MTRVHVELKAAEDSYGGYAKRGELPNLALKSQTSLPLYLPVTVSPHAVGCF